MRIEYPFPVEYVNGLPPFDAEGNITARVSSAVENVLDAYANVSRVQANYFHHNVRNYRISDVYVVGSGATRNADDSDLDLLLVAPRLDRESAGQVYLWLNQIFFADRPKIEAVDPYVFERIVYPNRLHIQITDQVKELVARCNESLGDNK